MLSHTDSDLVNMSDVELTDEECLDDSVVHCQYARTPCQLPRADKADGTLHSLCEKHQRQSALRRRQLQYKMRLLQRLATVMQRRDVEQATAEAREDAESASPRPRFVLLGNKKTLILGIVLSKGEDAVE